MSLAVVSCAGLPIWAAMFALYFLLRRHRLQRASLIAKCAGSFLAAGMAWLALVREAENPFSALGYPVFWFFVLCTAADALLEIRFVPGMALFAAAHVCLISTVLPRAEPVWNAVVWAAAMAAALAVFRRELPRMGVRLAVPACIYVGVLSCTLALCLPLPFFSGDVPAASAFSGWCMALGALSFFVSDLMVAKMEFGGLGDSLQKPVMVTYWLALYLFAASLF